MKKISLFSRCTYKVLQRHRVIDRFCANLKLLRPAWFEENGKGLNVLELIEKSGGLASGFSWDCTREGREFWFKIDCEVCDLSQTLRSCIYYENR